MAFVQNIHSSSVAQHAAYEGEQYFSSIPHRNLVERLKKWNPHIDESQLKVVSQQHVVWNDGSLGAPMPGHFYTQALVPGYTIFLSYGSELIEVHANQAMTSFAIPGFGFI